MLIKMVPYYPANMRQTHRVTHHFNVAVKSSCKSVKHRKIPLRFSAITFAPFA